MASLSDLRLELLKQTSIQEEKITKNGQTYNAHVVVKNSPFQIVYGLRSCGKASNANVDFNRFSFDIKLVYDVESEREVHYVSQKPVDCKPTITETGDQLSLDGVKIKVLSSHHEDNLFKIKLSVWETNNLNPVPLCLLSQPIKVISKPIKPRANTKKSGFTQAKETQFSSRRGDYSDSPTEEENSVETPRKKRTVSERDSGMESKMDLLLEELQKTREELSQHRGVQQQPTAMPSYQEDFFNDMFYENPTKKVKKEETLTGEELNGQAPSPAPKDAIEIHLKRLLQAFSSLLTAEGKAEQIKAILRRMGAREAHTLVELLDAFNVGLNDSRYYMTPQNFGLPSNGNPQLAPLGTQCDASSAPIPGTPGQAPHYHSINCTIGECPYKQEALFYNEMFFEE